MTKDAVYAYTRKLQAMVRRAREIEANIDQGDGMKAMLADVDPAKAMELGKQLADQRKVLGELVTTVNAVSKRDGLPAAEELITDLMARLELVENSYEQWRRERASYELAVSMEQLSPAERAEVEDELTKLHERYEKATALASDMVPSPGVVILA